MTKLILELPQKDGSIKKFNNGKPFDLPGWTVLKHKVALEEVNKLPKKADEETRDIEFQCLAIYETLKEVDSTITLKDIRILHPIVMADLFAAVYNEGKQEIYFQKKGKKAK